MKNRYLTLAIVMIITFTSVTAQQTHKNGYGSPTNFQKECRIDNLSDVQKENLKTERVKFHKEIQAEKNKLGELLAKKRTVETTDPLNLKNLNKLLAEISTVKTSMAKKHLRHLQTIKSQLTDEQLITFEQQSGKRGMKMQQCSGNNIYQVKGNRQNRRGHGQRNYKSNKNDGRRHGNGRIADCEFSDELKDQFKAARLELMQQQQPLNNQLNELKAQYKTITYGKSIDLKKADENLDEQGVIQLKIAKLHSQHKMEIRSQLSDEEKIWFDKKFMNRMPKGRMN